ncbi:MAG: hypothetical protein HUK25_09550 [Treponema sp.]|nr:hypothetical protein [Treponema sp.]
MRNLQSADMCDKNISRNVFLFNVRFISAIFLIASLITFSGCSKKISSSSIVGQLDSIDALISQGLNSSALKELKKTSKKVYDSWGSIGVYKRYKLLGENSLAEKTLVKALKKNPSNAELSAVYAGFLIDKGRLDEAEKIALCLKNTRYASIYSEAVLKNHADEISGNQNIYTDMQYFDLFYDSYTATKNPVWIRDCAAFYLSKGQYNEASELTPQAFSDADDAYFWALVNYDAGKYFNSINAAEYSAYFLESMNLRQTSRTSLLKLAAIESDCYMSVADSHNAHLVRDKVISSYVTGAESVSSLSKEDQKILPLMMVNSASCEYEMNHDTVAADLLTFSAINFSEYVPALIAYAEFAYNSNLERREDDEITALRKAGLKTREMERYDNRAKIPLSDALDRLEKALIKLKDPYLYITKLDLKYKTNFKLTERDKTSDLWNLLESSSTETERYRDILVLYAVNFFLETDQKEYADSLFRKYMISKLGLDRSKDIFEQITSRIKDCSVLDLEVAAWFATDCKKTEEAVRLYEYCTYESAGLRQNEISPEVSSQSALNLADIYYSTGQQSKALDLYGKIASRESNKVLRSEAFYRIACIYYAAGDTPNALRSVEYAYSINTENAKAHLLKAKLK